MPRTDRNNPTRGTASESRYSLMEFERDFPDDAACLEWIVARRFPEGIFCRKCERVTKHHRDARRPSFACQSCGTHVHPMVGTIFEDSATSLKLWFYGMYLMASTRCGISAKQLERELGVTYKTAWRMFHKIRTLLGQDGPKLDGTVEMDETFIGGQARWKAYGKKAQGHPTDKTPVVGMVQRGTAEAPARLRAKVVPSTRTATLLPMAKRNIRRGSTVFTDEWSGYVKLGRIGYDHGWINHSQKVYVRGDVHTNTIEGFFSLIKRGISGVYHGVSDEYLQTYLDEYVFRYNNRKTTIPGGVFGALLLRAAPVAR